MGSTDGSGAHDGRAAGRDAGSGLGPDAAERLRAECLRVYHRYAVEVVEALQLCPWARRARLDGRVRARVILDQAPAAERVLDQVDDIFRDARIDIGLFLLPRVSWGPRGFRRFVERLRRAHAERHEAGDATGPPPLAMADFHPGVEPDLSSAARLVSFLRCTPDPTVQVVRRGALEAVQGTSAQGSVYEPRAVLSLDLLAAHGGAPTHQRVAEANLATVTRVGVARVQALLDDIRADRDRAYARLGLPQPGREP